MSPTKRPTTKFIQVMTYSQAFGQAPPARPFALLRDYPTDTALLRIAAGFFTGVFPGNISQYTHHHSAFGLNSDKKG